MDDRWFRLGDHCRYPAWVCRASTIRHVSALQVQLLAHGKVRMQSFHFSLRSLAVLVTAYSIHIASIAAFASQQGKIPFVMLLTYAIFWLAPMISLGYDRQRSWRGMLNGFAWGTCFCVGTYWLFGFKLLRSYSVYS